MKKKSTQNLTPTPTEYSGVVFRSKTEAMFAWALDQVDCVWSYEPELFFTQMVWSRLSEDNRGATDERLNAIFHSKTKGYTPDFDVYWKCRKTQRMQRLWIELKPSNVTKTYLRKTSEILKLACGVDFNAAIVVGSPYGNKTTISVERVGMHGLAECNPENCQTMEFLRAVAHPYLLRSSSHRFDLAA